MEKVLNIALLYQKLFCLFTEYTEEIILNEGSLRGSPTITFALNKEKAFFIRLWFYGHGSTKDLITSLYSLARLTTRGPSASPSPALPFVPRSSI